MQPVQSDPTAPDRSRDIRLIVCHVSCRPVHEAVIEVLASRSAHGLPPSRIVDDGRIKVRALLNFPELVRARR